jgi:hypothetical protein
MTSRRVIDLSIPSFRSEFCIPAAPFTRTKLIPNIYTHKNSFCTPYVQGNAWDEQGVVSISIRIKQVTPGEMKVLIEQARKRGLTMAAHLENYDWEYDVESRDAILKGLDRHI